MQSQFCSCGERLPIFQTRMMVVSSLYGSCVRSLVSHLVTTSVTALTGSGLDILTGLGGDLGAAILGSFSLERIRFWILVKLEEIINSFLHRSHQPAL